VPGAASPRYGQLVHEGIGEDRAVSSLTRLPPGRHGLSREFVTQNQRGRLVAATIAIVAASGLNEATIAQICAAAGVSRRTFYTNFSSKQDCFFATYHTILRHLRLETDAAATEQTEWPQVVAAKIQAMLGLLAANPDLAKFLFNAPQRAGDEVAARYRVLMARSSEYMREGMPALPETRAPSAAVAASLMGGMVALIVRKVNSGEGEGLLDLLPDLVELYLTPYIGRAEAVRVAGEAA